MNEEKLFINGIEYERVKKQNDMPYVIIRTYSAGVHAGYLKKHEGKEVKLINSRRLWKWAGALTLSEMSVDGVSKPNECKFACVLPSIILTEAIEIIPCSEKAKESIEGVQRWTE